MIMIMAVGQHVITWGNVENVTLGSMVPLSQINAYYQSFIG